MTINTMAWGDHVTSNEKYRNCYQKEETSE